MGTRRTPWKLIWPGFNVTEGDTGPFGGTTRPPYCRAPGLRPRPCLLTRSSSEIFSVVAALSCAGSLAGSGLGAAGVGGAASGGSALGASGALAGATGGAATGALADAGAGTGGTAGPCCAAHTEEDASCAASKETTIAGRRTAGPDARIMKLFPLPWPFAGRPRCYHTETIDRSPAKNCTSN